MTTAFSKVTAAIVAALQAAPAVSAQIYRARDRSVPENCADAVNVQFEGSEPNRGAINGAPVDWISRIAVDCYARSRTLEGDEAVDELLQSVYERLAANPTLGGVVDDIGEPDIVADYDSLGQKTGWVRLTYPILHRTTGGSLE